MPGLRAELERLRDGGPVDEETLRKVALAALRFVPEEELVQELSRRGRWRTERLHLVDREGQLLDDLTPEDGWRRS
jgi:hypothetical protein